MKCNLWSSKLFIYKLNLLLIKQNPGTSTLLIGQIFQLKFNYVFDYTF